MLLLASPKCQHISQPSDSLANDGGNYTNNDPTAAEGFDNQNIMFAPADPTDSIKKRKKEKKSRSKDTSNNKQSPSSTSSSKDKRLSKSSSLSTSNTKRSGSSRRTVHHKNATPPRVPRSKSMNAAHFDDAGVCYAEWWMSCFPDAFK